MISYKEQDRLHPLIRYIRNWRAFNAAARKSNHYLLMKLLIVCLAVTLGIIILLS